MKTQILTILTFWEKLFLSKTDIKSFISQQYLLHSFLDLVAVQWNNQYKVQRGVDPSVYSQEDLQQGRNHS